MVVKSVYAKTPCDSELGKLVRRDCPECNQKVIVSVGGWTWKCLGCGMLYWIPVNIIREVF
jgi:ribosomal protein L37AE/L43A